VARCESLLAKTGVWLPLRPALGGLAVGLLALLTPQVMSSGHGALHFASIVSMPLTMIATVFVLKALASVISLGSGFRGGLFFATLFLGALGGRLFAAGIDTIWPGLNLDPNVYAIVGMSALSASVIGGPLTMRSSRWNPLAISGSPPRCWSRSSSRPRSPANCSVTRSRPGDSTCAARPFGAPPTWAGSAISRCGA
jgi:hypothetical protein